MGVVTSRLPRLRLPKTKARAAAEEQQRKIEQLCVMFPMLDKDTLVMVLDANDGDISKTMEMFMPLNPAMSEEHQQRPLSRTGPPGRPSKDEMKSISELMRWASSSDLDTQYQAVRSLADLAMSEDQRAHIVHAGASKQLVKMLSADRAEVQLCALIAVANLALNDEGQTSLNKEGAIQPLIAMSEASDPTVQFHAARALANLAFCHEDNEAAIAERGFPALLALVDSGELMVQQEALAAIANLARNTDNQRKIVESGALASLANVLRSPARDPSGELLQQGARCLANLSLNEANEAALVASNRADKLGPIMIAMIKWYRTKEVATPLEAAQKLVERVAPLVPTREEQDDFHARVWREDVEDSIKHDMDNLKRAFKTHSGREDALSKHKMCSFGEWQDMCESLNFVDPTVGFTERDVNLCFLRATRTPDDELHDEHAPHRKLDWVHWIEALMRVGDRFSESENVDLEPYEACIQLFERVAYEYPSGAEKRRRAKLAAELDRKQKEEKAAEARRPSVEENASKPPKLSAILKGARGLGAFKKKS